MIWNVICFLYFSVTSSLSQFTHSPPVNVPSTSIEPVFTNNVTAAITNSSYAPLSACKNDLLLPSALERTIKVVKGMDTLGERLNSMTNQNNMIKPGMVSAY